MAATEQGHWREVLARRVHQLGLHRPQLTGPHAFERQVHHPAAALAQRRAQRASQRRSITGQRWLTSGQMLSRQGGGFMLQPPTADAAHQRTRPHHHPAARGARG